MLLRAMVMPVLAAALVSATATGDAVARTTFDGIWSILIVTLKGDCDTAYRYRVQVVNGAVRYAGDAAIDLVGRVQRSGAVRVTVRHGDQSATAIGRLSTNAGAGHWTGRSPRQQCSGRWEAERR